MAEQSKAEFVRSLPATMTAKDVIAKAKEKGITLSAAYVYVIRSKGAGGKTRSATKRAPNKRNGAGAVEKQFISLALDLGFARAQAILNDSELAFSARSDRRVRDVSPWSPPLAGRDCEDRTQEPGSIDFSATVTATALRRDGAETH